MTHLRAILVTPLTCPLALFGQARAAMKLDELGHSSPELVPSSSVSSHMQQLLQATRSLRFAADLA